MENTIVDVIIPTFNQENYIKQCLESIINQKTNFEFRIIVGDDFSTDSTVEILKSFHKKYQKQILPVYNKKNMGPNLNFQNLYEKSNSKYIALCDGDDYWIDQYKLQKQIDILEKNENYNLCFTDCKTLIQNENKIIDSQLKNKIINEIDIYDIAEGKNKFYLYTANVVFRNVDLKIPENFLDKIGFDTSLFLLLLEHNAKGIFLPEPTSIYRIHDKSIFSSRNLKSYEERKKIELGMYEMVDAWEKYFGYDKILVKYFRRSKLSTLNKLRIISCENNDIKTIKNISRRCLQYIMLDKLNIKLLISCILSFTFPKLYFNYLTKSKISIFNFH